MDTKNKVRAALNALDNIMGDISFRNVSSLKTMGGIIQILEDIVLSEDGAVVEIANKK